MPLVRFELKNQFGLGDPRLYQGAPKEEEDPRNILGGVTVSGLVGILRQLGDLAEFAAVVFHDVHQQVMTTSARGHKVLNRIQKIEAALPQFEKAVKEEKSHIHFAYVAGCDWHANILTGQSQLFGSNLPEFMLDSYEECRDPPRLHLLDKFDNAGAGACLKRYSDPSYFRMLMASSESIMVDKAHSRMKVQRKKKQRSRGRNGLARNSLNMTLHGRSSVQFASLVTDELSFSADDASSSDTLPIFGSTTERTYLSSDKRSGCLEVQNTPSPMSRELYDGMSATDAETTQKVDCIFNNDNKVSDNDYVIQDSLHQQNDPSSSSISSDEKTEMVKFVNQMLSHDIPEDGLKFPKAAELSSALSNINHVTDGLGVQGESATDNLGAWVKSVSSLSSTISKENATGDPEMQGSSVSSTYSAASAEKTEIIESASSKFPDDIIPYKPPGSDLLFVTLETSNLPSEMDDTEMHNQENVLPDNMKMVPSLAGDQISELKSLGKHMDATNALDSKVQTNFEHYTGQGVICLPHLDYNGMECEINKILGITTPSLDGVDGEIAHEACTSLKTNISTQDFDYLQSPGSGEFAHWLHYSVENAVSESLASDSTMENDSESVSSASCPVVIIPVTQAAVIDGIPPEESSSQDSFGYTSAKTAGEKEILCERQTKQEAESTTDSNCQGTESRSSTATVSAASKLDCPDSETHVASFNSAPCPGIIIPSTQTVVVDGVPREESLSQDSFGGIRTAGEKEVFCEHQTKQETESTDESNCQGNEYPSSMEKVIAASKLDGPASETHVASFNSAPCPGVIISSTQAVVIDGYLPLESLSQDSFADTSVKTAGEKEILCEHQTKPETESTDDSNCQGNGYQSSMEKVIAASKLDGPDSETHVASFDSAPYPAVIIPSIQAVVIDGIPRDEFAGTAAKTASEKEVLCEHQTKQQTESLADSNCQKTEYQSCMEKVAAASKFDGPDSKTHVASCGSSDDYASPMLCGLIISNGVNNISSSTLSSDVMSSRSLINIFSPRNESEDPHGDISAQLTNTSVISPSDVTAVTTVETQGFPVYSLSKSSINIWTNGGLLGLEPSKPQDISVPNVYGSDDRSAANSQPCGLGNGNESRKLFFEADKLNHVVSFPEQDNIMGKISDVQSDSMLSKQHSKSSIQASSFCKLDKAQNAYFGGVLGKGGGTISSEADIYSKNEPKSTLSRQNNIGISVSFSSLAHRFLINSLQRKSSMTGISPLFELMNNDVHKLHGNKIHSKNKERPKLAISSAPLHKLENKEDLAHGFSEKLVTPSLDSSGYQSPPLEHMKVSFQPMNDSDASKLKLEFCSSSQQQGNMGDMMFPSFQLLTESFQPLLDGVLESDDDSFCRSCPYSSDDLFTLHSESDAEIWGEDEIDISHRTEATGSISSSTCNVCRVSQVNDVENLKHGIDELSFNSGEIVDLPNVSSLEISQRQSHMCNPSMQQTDLLSLLPNELQTPSSLPPSKWRVMKSSSAYIENTVSGEVETDHY